jgi:diguanylate cyclase
MLEKVNREMIRDKKKNWPIALVFIDLDNFKKINNNRGHKFGDFLLKLFICLIEKNIRPGDVFSKWGDNKFILIFPKTTKEEVRQIIGNVYSTFPRFSWGISTESINEAIARAYWAKKAKRN